MARVRVPGTIGRLILTCRRRTGRDEDYVERARELLDVAVASATHDTPRVAIATSGGLDSSAIAATAARQGRAESITCFCMVPPPGTDVDVGPFRYLDERDKVEELARMYPSLNIRFIAPDRIHPKAYDDTLYFVPANLPSLAPASFGVGPYRPEAVAAAGHRTVLIGNYGNFGLTWRGDFSLVELVRAHQWKDFARELHEVARESNRSLVRTLAGDVVMPAAPIWLRRLIYRLRGRDPDSVAHYSALNPTFIADAGLARQWRVRDFDPWFGLWTFVIRSGRALIACSITTSTAATSDEPKFSAMSYATRMPTVGCLNSRSRSPNRCTGVTAFPARSRGAYWLIGCRT